MRTGIFAFAIGCWLCQQQMQLVPDFWLWAALPALFLLFVRWRPLRFLAALSLGFLWANAYSHTLSQSPFPNEWQGEDVVVEGSIASLPQAGERSTRFLFAADSLRINGRQTDWTGKLRLSWYDSVKHVVPDLAAGDRWQLTVRLKHPHGFANPGSFDMEAWLFAQGVKATGYVRPKGDHRLLLQDQPRYYLHRLRQHLRDQLADLLPEAQTNGLLQALAMGDRSNISPAQWQVLMATGTNHLMAISGLHIGLLAGLAFFIVRWCWAWIPPLCLRWPAPRAAAVAAMLIATIYALLAGFSIPTQRAWVMTMVVMALLLFYRPLSSSQILSLAMLAVLLWDPLALMSAGFYLSFLAVAVIVYVLAHRHQPFSWWHQWGRMQWSLGLALIPLSLLYFQQASLISPVANLIAVPWVSFLVVPWLLLASMLSVVAPMLAGWLLYLVSQSMEALWWLLQWASSWPAGIWRHAVAAPWVLLSTGLAMALLLAPRGLPARWLGVVFLLPLLAFKTPGPREGEVWLTQLDVGQGLALVVRTANHLLLFDTGARFGAMDMGESVVTPYLRSQGAQAIDVLLISHGDNDHIGGAQHLLQQWPVGRLLSSEADKLVHESKERCEAGQRWQWDGVEFSLLHPNNGDKLPKENDQSCVLHVRTDGGSVLLSGDIERAAEKQLLVRQPEALAADILIAPHHGSATSSTPAFIKAVSPQHVLFAAGYRNRFRHPREEVVQRYREFGAQIWRSDEHGAVEFMLTRAGISTPQTHRQNTRRYWHRPTSTEE
jgi:competence protein ComEC